MGEDLLAATAPRYEQSAKELDRAAAHLRVAAEHFPDASKAERAEEQQLAVYREVRDAMAWPG